MILVGWSERRAQCAKGVFVVPVKNGGMLSIPQPEKTAKNKPFTFVLILIS
jgi:hypothetical protein